MSQPEVLVLGAGPAGLTAAHEIQRHDRRVAVLEADPERVGGRARTVEHHGYRFDLGGHRFVSKNPEVEALWTAFLGDEMLTRDPEARIHDRGRYFHHPFRAGNALAHVGPVETVRSLASYLDARLHPMAAPLTFEDWVNNRYGRRLAQTFFKNYAEKVWGRSTRALSADWAAQQLGGPAFNQKLRSAAAAVRDRAGNRKPAGGQPNRFRYPRLGPGQLWEEVADQLRTSGTEVLLGERVVQVERLSEGGLRVLAERPDGSQERHLAPRIVSTLALRDLVGMIRPAAPAAVGDAAAALDYRALVSVCLIVRGERVFPGQTVYVHDPNFKVARLQNFRGWSPDMAGADDTTGLGLEYFCSEGDALWSTDDASLVALGTEELVRLRLIAPQDVLDGLVVRQAKACPVLDDGYRDRVEVIRRWLSREWPDLQTCGGNGMHKAALQDHAMLTGLVVARRIAGDSDQDPWLVTADAQYP